MNDQRTLFKWHQADDRVRVPPRETRLAVPGRRPTLLLLLLAALVVTTGPAFAEDAPPVVTDGSVTPDMLDFNGGPVDVTATVTDDVGVATVSVLFTGENGTYIDGALLPAGGDTYAGSVTLPPNDTEYALSYGVDVTATDTTGQQHVLGIARVSVQPRPFVDDPPFVVDPLVSPRILPSTGGTLQLGVSAWDLHGISEAYATITHAGAEPWVIGLTQTGETRFGTPLQLPPNETFQPVVYGVRFTAHDDIGQRSSVDGGQVTVEAAPPASPAKLAVSPAARSFGAIAVGRLVTRTITVRNTGGSRVAGTIAPPPAPFAVGTEPGAGVAFDLVPGASITVPVRFLPKSAGVFARTLRIRRADGQQPRLGVTLAGVGLPRR